MRRTSESGFRLRCAPRNDVQQKSPRPGAFSFPSSLDAAQCASAQTFFLVKYIRPAKMIRTTNTWKPMLLARFHVRLGGPHQEGGDVLGVLRNRRRRAVVEGHLAVGRAASAS